MTEFKLRVHPLAALIPLLGLALGMGAEVPALLVSLVVHEAGHLAAAKLAGVRVEALTVMPFGCGLRLGNVYLLSPGQALAVAAGGPLASLGLLFVGGALAQWGALSPAPALELMRADTALLLFNLLPALPLDGGRMLYAVTAKRLGRTRAVRLGAAMGTAVAALMVAGAVVLFMQTHQLNLTLPLCAVFMLSGIAEDRRALTDAVPASLLNALKGADEPVEMRVWAVSEDLPVVAALRAVTAGAGALFAVYRGEELMDFIDERGLMEVAMKDIGARVGMGLQREGRVA